MGGVTWLDLYTLYILLIIITIILSVGAIGLLLASRGESED